MKIAVSIPDELFETADKTAKRLNLTRSELYQKAIERFVEDLDEEELLNSLNKTYDKIDSKLDKSIENMQTETIISGLGNDTW